MSTYEVRTDPIRINAPIDVVWEVLTDVENYGQWNPFTPQAHTDFKIGSPARLRVRMGPTTMKITETVCAYETPRLILPGARHSERVGFCLPYESNIWSL